MDGVPEARGERRAYAELPAPVHDEVDRLVGGRAAQVRDVPIGFSPGVAAAVHGSGGACFVKAVHADVNTDSVGIHRREAEVLRGLEGTGVRAPRLLAHLEVEGWTVVVTDLVPGANPPLPWTTEGIDALLGALVQVHEVDGSALDLLSIGEELATSFGGWAAIAADERRDRLPAWARPRLRDLIAIEAGWREAAEGAALLHLDARGDNLLVDPVDGTGTLVDWPWATHGHPAVDVVLVAPSIAMQGGPRPEELLARSGHTPDDDRVRTLAVAATGMFLAWSLLAPPPGLPTLRPFQGAQAHAGLAWLARLLP